MTTVTALLTNKAYGYPTRGTRRRRKPTILACLHQTANAKATAMQERNYATLPRTPTARQVDVLVAYVAAGGSVSDAAALVGARPSTAKRHLADLRARSGLTTEQLIYRGRAKGWLVVPGYEPKR